MLFSDISLLQLPHPPVVRNEDDGGAGERELQVAPVPQQVGHPGLQQQPKHPRSLQHLARQRAAGPAHQLQPWCMH